MGLTEAATHKVGPLPAWGWGAIAVGGFVAWRMFGSSGGNGTTAAGVPSVGAPGDLGSGGGGGGGSTDTSTIDTVKAALESLQSLVTGQATQTQQAQQAIQQSVSNLADQVALQPSLQDIASLIPQPTAPLPYSQTTIDKLQGYISNLQADTTRTAAQNTELATYKQRLASYLAANEAAAAAAAQVNPGNPTGEVLPIVGAAPQYTDEISALRSYISNLQKDGVTSAEATKIATYQARIQDYTARDVAAASGAPPTFSSTPTSSGGGITAPSVTAAPVNYSQAISTVNGYIANLSAVKNPTTAQKSELAMYQARLADYQSR